MQKRHLDLKGILSGQAKELAEPDQPFDDKLFGPDINKHFNNILAANKVSLKIAGKPRGGGNHHHHPFLGQQPRGNFRMQSFGRGFNPPNPPPFNLFPWFSPLGFPAPQRQTYFNPQRNQNLQNTQRNSSAARSHGSQTIQNNDKVLHLFPKIPKPDLPVGGWLKYFKSNWFNLTKDPKLIEMVTSCPIKLTVPPPNKHMPPIHMSKAERTAAREHIAALLKKQAIICCKKSTDDFISSVFLVPKTDSGFRLILNLKEFNKYAEKIHFKMETIQSIRYLVTQNCFMTNIDLVDAFLTVPLKRALCHLFKFTFEGQVFMYTSLPFGYTDLPRISQKF